MKMSFIKGMLTGALAGGAAMLLLDPISPRQRRRMKKQANRVLHSVGDMFDCVSCSKHDLS